MSDTVISVENVSKLYRLGEVGTGTLSHDLNRWWHRVRGKEDPYLKIGQTNDRTKKGSSEYAWVLKDIGFKVKRGEVLGIIGRNGAGKSTLLKILSRVTTPTTGEIKIKGRIASLLEVGTGFNPELTGRDNIYLNGAILGMRKREIDRKFDEIVAFSEVDRYIDTPVKRYSSGMYVRLAFGVAAHLEPEILIVDEVLSVGDAEFQKKCLGKMHSVARGGRTVLFVSHNLLAVRELCERAVLLQHGHLVRDGLTEEVAYEYAKSNIKTKKLEDFPERETGFLDVQVVDGEGENLACVFSDKHAFVKLRLRIGKNSGVVAGFTLFNQSDVPLVLSTTVQSRVELQAGEFVFTVRLPTELMQPGHYRIEGAIWDARQVYHQEDNLCHFEVMASPGHNAFGRTSAAQFALREPWSLVSS